jgi:citrate lyase subunit beta/citryl-CoA lyase
MRSKLFVPGARPELFEKALAGDADALSFDLEDSVPEARKDEARAAVADCLRGDSVRGSRKLIIVRCNPVGSAPFDADLAALSDAGLALLNLPKVESVEQVLATAVALDRHEQGADRTRTRLLLNIETPRSLRIAAQLAAAHPRVVGLQLGLGDLFEPYGIARRELANVHAAMFALRMAAAEANVFAMDGAFAAIDDAARFEAEAQMAVRLGFIGKSCIHPRQVALANRVFGPSEDELAEALRIVEAARVAADAGQAVFALDGRMIDGPYLKRAEAIVEAAGRMSPR